jgi:hypothetical protein
VNPGQAPLRVAVWTTGNVILQAVRAILLRPDLELVGAFARSHEKHGIDLGNLCGMDGQLGVRATAQADELLAVDLDCIVYSPLHLDVAELARILSAGVNVVTPRRPNLVIHPSFSRRAQGAHG